GTAPLDPVGEPEAHRASGPRLEPRVGAEPRRERTGIHHEAPHVLRGRLDRLLVDLVVHDRSGLRSATDRLPGSATCGRFGNLRVAIVPQGGSKMRAGIPTVIGHGATGERAFDIYSRLLPQR